MDYLRRVEDLFAPEIIAVVLQCTLADQVHLPPKNVFELILHPRMSNTVTRACGANETNTSTSLSGRKSVRRTEPNNASSEIFHRLQNAASYASEMLSFGSFMI